MTGAGSGSKGLVPLSYSRAGTAHSRGCGVNAHEFLTSPLISAGPGATWPRAQKPSACSQLSALPGGIPLGLAVFHTAPPPGEEQPIRLSARSRQSPPPSSPELTPFSQDGCGDRGAQGTQWQPLTSHLVRDRDMASAFPSPPFRPHSCPFPGPTTHCHPQQQFTVIRDDNE